MKKKKLFVVAGTRPEMIKVAPLVRDLLKAPWADAELLLTGQHAEVIMPLLKHFEIIRLKSSVPWMALIDRT